MENAGMFLDALVLLALIGGVLGLGYKAANGKNKSN